MIRFWVRLKPGRYGYDQLFPLALGPDPKPQDVRQVNLMRGTHVLYTVIPTPEALAFVSRRLDSLRGITEKITSRPLTLSRKEV